MSKNIFWVATVESVQTGVQRAIIKLFSFLGEDGVLPQVGKVEAVLQAAEKFGDWRSEIGKLS